MGPFFCPFISDSQHPSPPSSLTDFSSAAATTVAAAGAASTTPPPFLNPKSSPPPPLFLSPLIPLIPPIPLIHLIPLSPTCLNLVQANEGVSCLNQSMKGFDCLQLQSRKVTNRKQLERHLSLREYKQAVSWSKYLISDGAEIKGEGEERWSADMSELFIGNKFASGKHSRIYRGVYKGLDVAIKLMSQPQEDADLAAVLEGQFTSEVALLFRLKHPNIITFVAACKKPPVFCIITEYMSGGSLRKYLHQQEPHSVPLNLVLRLSLDVARGMQYLHSEGILHRDLKSENLLLGEDMAVKVADFGISCLESEPGSAKGFTSTYRWMAPEMIKEEHHTKKVDVYSFGIVLWEILTALIPFADLTPEQAAFAVCQKNARPPLPPNCPRALSDLIKRCWAANPERRPHFDEIVNILEFYTESFEKDPKFFSSFRPHHNRFLPCFPKITAQRFTSLKA